MVEVFKTNVIDAIDAQKIIDKIHESFANYQANFALDDCDKILRIKCLDDFFCADSIFEIIAAYGFEASILVDDFQPSTGLIDRNTQLNLIF